MSEPTNVVLEKQIGDHTISVLIYEENGEWEAINQCSYCQTHNHIMIDTLDDTNLSLLAHEHEMHASGSSSGWNDGIGFQLED